MAEKVMNNVREKLSQSRKMCEGMSERAYLLADYMSEIAASDTITPFGLVACLSRAIEDTYQERWREGTKKQELCLSLLEDAKRIRNQAVNIPQIIDVIADEDFAEEFRAICKEKFDFNPPKYGTPKQLEEYPEYVKVAVNWWANAIFFPKLDTPGAAVPTFLVQIIEEEVGVKSYYPCDALEVAGKKIDVHQAFGYPLRTSMSIWKDEVEVKVGDGGKFKTLWTK